MSYAELKEKYRITDEEYLLMSKLRRKYAFEDLDAEIESYAISCKETYNDGKKLDPTDDEVEQILDDYLERRLSDYAIQDEIDDMREAIYGVTGVYC